MKKFLLIQAALFVAVTAADAVITVTGLTTKTAYDNAVTFTVPNEAGFTTVCTLDGTVISAAAGFTSNVPGYHELRITKTPTGGGTAETALYQYIIQDAANRNGGNADNGLPTWVPQPQVDAPAAVLNACTASFVVPQRIPAGVPLPVIVRLTESGGQIAKVNATALTYEPGGRSMAHRIYRGAGAGQYPSFSQDGTKQLALGFSGGVRESRSVQCVASPAWTALSGTLSGTVVIPAGSFVHVNGSLSVPAGVSLSIGAGTVIKLDAGADIEVQGTMTVNGSTADPVLFYPATAGTRWGGIWVYGTAGDLDMTGAILTGACEQSNWLSVSPHNFGGHHADQPVITFSGLAAITTVELTDTYIVDNLPGQAFHGESSNITLTRCIIQRATSGGQIDGGRVRVVDSHFVEFSRDDGIFEDDDNDGLYMTGGTNEMIRSVWSNCKDDGCDAGSGPGGTMTIDGCWFDSCWHEAMAWSCDASPSRVVNISNTVAINSGQGVEAGFGGSTTGPQVTAVNSFFAGNAVGARFGDNYDWDYPGSLTVRNSFLLNNLRDVWGMEWDTWTYRTDRMTIEDNRLSVPNDKHPANAIFDPAVDGALLAPFITHPGLPRGFGLTGRASQNPRASYGGSLSVHLDRPATGPVVLPWRVVVRSALESGVEITAAQGTVEFSAGQTVRTFALPALPSPQSTWPWVAVLMDGQAGFCEPSGLSAVHFLDTQTPAALTLIARGASWRYYDGGDPGAVPWTTAGFSETGWKTGNAEIGFGDGDEVTALSSATADKRNTYYFRRKFTVTDPAQFSAVTLLLQRDDGAVVYLNGSEVWRSNMPATGTISYATSASSAQSNADEDAFWPKTWNLAANPGLLIPGENIIAVEVHQISSSASDISFNLELTGTTEVPATWHAATVGGAMHFFWTGSRMPQVSADLNNWVERPDVRSPWRIGDAALRAFFRLAP